VGCACPPRNRISQEIGHDRIYAPHGFVNSVHPILQGNRAGAAGAVMSASGGRRHAGDGPLHLLPDGLDWQTRPADRLRPRRAEHLLGRDPQQRREGEPSPSAATQRANEVHTSPRIALLRPPLCKVAARKPEATGSGFPWKSATTEFTNPTGSRESRPAIHGSPLRGEARSRCRLQRNFLQAVKGDACERRRTRICLPRRTV
jgi:hypothetical protein